MRLTYLTLPILALPAAVSASLAADVFTWANDLVSSSPTRNGHPSKGVTGGDVHTMDSWSYVDCGLATDVV